MGPVVPATVLIRRRGDIRTGLVLAIDDTQQPGGGGPGSGFHESGPEVVQPGKL